ncbi:hypothetical protein TrCOL_g13325 [Triparma columacea]|nr:hypothetical protein TrCOL_g13325 [Triparma columacea]
MIDAGSGGSRLHVYEYDRRSFSTLPPPVSDVATDSQWTKRLKPGLSSFANVREEELPAVLADYMRPMLTFAKKVLKEKKSHWGEYHIYLKATGGMRTLSVEDRTKLMDTVRDLFQNKYPELLKNPFRIDGIDQIRVISGEEEAIYGWTAINYLMGTLISNSGGSGTVISPNITYGALDMGGASTQISFYEPGEDIMSNLFKMQLGGSKHWNVYAHSFLYFGINSARERNSARIVHEQDKGRPNHERLSGRYYNPCFNGGYETNFTSKIHFNDNDVESWLSSSAVGNNAQEYSVSLYGGVLPDTDFHQCYTYTVSLLRKESNAWCDFAHGGDCSYAGIYQPPIPYQSARYGGFFAFANYLKLWHFLKLPIKANVGQVKARAEEICSMSFDELINYNSEIHKKGKDVNLEELSDYCFHSTYTYSMLHDGYGFSDSTNITVASIINGQKVTWALGSALYEINSLDWTYTPGQVEQAFVGMGVVLSSVVTVCCVFLSLQLYKERRHRGASLWSIKPDGPDRHGYGAVEDI